jgi:guanine deaminase
VKYKAFLADILNPISDKKCEYIKDGILILKDEKIVEYGKRSILNKYDSIEVHDYSKHILMPGFFDMHFHWVQDDVRHMPKANLLTWLKEHTWPSEAKFKNKSYSLKKAKQFKKRLHQVGTVGGACYSSIHDHSLEHAFNEFDGDFIIGNVLMTMESPKNLTQSKENALSLVKRFSKKYKHRYALTPRFAPTTHPDVMKEAGKIARQNKSFMQTHLCETPNEIEMVMDLYRNNFKGFEDIESYTHIYHKVGLLGKRSLFGHAIYLSESEKKLLAKTKSPVVHCPTSNASLRQKGLGSGLFDFKAAEKAGIDWALGSDIGGGPYLSMFDVLRSYVDQNNKAGVKGATFTKALYRATLKGAEILNLSKRAGNFSKSKDGTFILLTRPKDEVRNAEEAITKLVKRAANKRAGYDDLVKGMFLRGERLF